MARSINVMCWCSVLMHCVNAVPVCWCSVLMKCVNAVCWWGVLMQCFNAMCWCSVLMQCWWYKKHQSNHWTDIWPNWQSITLHLNGPVWILSLLLWLIVSYDSHFYFTLWIQYMTGKSSCDILCPHYIVADGTSTILLSMMLSRIVRFI